MEDHRPSSLFALAKVLRHISMLDVCIVGVFICQCSSGAYKEYGMTIDLSMGLMALTAAEALHYITYCNVSAAAEYICDTASRKLACSLKATRRSGRLLRKQSRGECG